MQLGPQIMTANKISQFGNPRWKWRPFKKTKNHSISTMDEQFFSHETKFNVVANRHLDNLKNHDIL